MKKLISISVCISLLFTLCPSALPAYAADLYWIQTFTGYDGSAAPEGISTGSAVGGVDVYGTAGLFGKSAEDIAFTHEVNAEGEDAPTGWETYPQWNMDSSLKVSSFGNSDIFCWGYEFALDSYYGAMDIRLNVNNTDGTAKNVNLLTMSNNQKGKTTCMGTLVTSEIPLNTWVNFDFVFRTYENTIDVYYNGEKVISKLDLSSTIGTAATTKVNFYRMFMFCAQVDGAYVHTKKYMDNFYAKIVTEEPVISIPAAASNSDKVTVDEAAKTITADDSLTADEFKACFTLPDGASIEVDNMSGITQTSTLLPGYVRIKSADNKYSYYTLETYTSPDTVKTYPLSVYTNADNIVMTMGGASSDLGTSKTDNFEAGTSLTLKSVSEDENKTFLYWKDSSGTILSYNEEYSFTTGSGASLSAIYSDKTLGSFITFRNANNKIIAAGQQSSGITVPQSPYLMGYAFDGWYIGDIKQTLNPGDTVGAYDTDIMLYAGYTKAQDSYTVAINSENHIYSYNEAVTVTAKDTDDAGQPFMYWMKDLNIVSYHKEYTFYVSGSSVLTAVYGTDSQETDGIIVSMANPSVVERNKLAFFAEFNLPEEYSVIEMGILLNETGALSLGNYTHKAVSVSNKNKHQFTIRKANLSSGDTWYAAAYVMYSDSEGNVKIKYSNEVSKTLIIVDPITALTINTPSNLEQNETVKSAVSFTVLPTPDKDIDTSTIEWYVNGILQPSTSDKNTEFTYTPATTGTYEVYAKISGAEVYSETRTINVTKAEESDIVVLNEQFNYGEGYDFKESLPADWTHLNVTGSADAKLSASLTVATDPDNPENLIVKQLAPYELYQSNRLEKKLPEGLTAPIVVTGLAKITHGEAADPSFSVALISGSSGYKQFLQYSARSDGRVSGTNGIMGYITNNGWVRYTALISINTADLTQSKAKFMLSGNGNVSQTSGGAGTYITTDEYTVDFSGVTDVNTVAPTFRFSYGYGSPLGAHYYSYYDDIRIYYPKVLKASLSASENVFVDEAIEVSFNHNVDPLTLNSENIILKNTETGEEVSKTVEFDPLSVYGVRLIPENALDYAASYTIEFSSSVVDIAGLSVSAPLTFTTQPAPDENSIRLSTSEITVYEDESDSSVEVYINSASAAEDKFTVKSDNAAVADWSEGKILGGIPGSATLSFISLEDNSKAKLTVTTATKPRSADYIKSVVIPSETVIGEALISMADGVLSTDWTTAEGTTPYTVSDSVIGGNAMAFSSGTNHSVRVFTDASSKYVFEAKILAADGDAATQLCTNLGPLFKITDSENTGKKAIYLGASVASALEIDANTWYHFKAILTTDENFRTSEIRYFIDNTEVYQEGQAYEVAQVSSVGIYSESESADEAIRLDSLYFYESIEDEIVSIAVPSETIEGDILYKNDGVSDDWDHISGTSLQTAFEYAPSKDILNTVSLIKNASRASTLSKYFDFEPNSTYIYETKMKLTDGVDGFKIKIGQTPLITVLANDEDSKTILFGNSTDSVGYTLPTDTWFVFKAAVNTDGGKKVSALSFYINNTEVYQEGQEPASPYEEADRLTYLNENISTGEAVRLDDTYIYKTLWLTGVRADIFELRSSGEEFNSASQITRSGEAEMILALNNGTRNTQQPKIVVEYYDESAALLSSDTQDAESEIAPGEGLNVNMTLNIPDGIAGGTMKINVYDSTGTEQLTQPVEKTINTGGVLFLESVYGDNSILQRDMPINISGTAPTGATVTVEFAGTTASAVAENNRFTVILPAQEASFENRTLTVTAVGDNFSETKTVNNVQVGDVYYASGQSNMDWRMNNTPYGDHTIPANVRFIKIEYTTTAAQRVDRHTYSGAALNESWKELNDQTIDGCASVMFFMAQKMRNSGVDVPIGIIDCSLGGTSISAWVGKDVFANESAYESYNQQYLEGNANIGSLYNFMFKPVSSYTFKAMVWYQGEQDFAAEYEKLLPPMVAEYRSDVGRDFPIMVVQLPGLNHVYRDIRFRQAYAVSTMEDAYLIVTNDTGDAVDVHPANKDVVGDRLARVALNKLYGMDIAYSGPAFKAMTATGSTVTLELDYVNDGIHGGLSSMNEDASLPGFELAGADGNFYAATAVIDGDTVKLTSDSVTEPVYVRYGYVGEVFTSLGNNTDGYMLPMGCFRTDGKF